MEGGGGRGKKEGPTVSVGPNQTSQLGREGGSGVWSLNSELSSFVLSEVLCKEEKSGTKMGGFEGGVGEVEDGPIDEESKMEGNQPKKPGSALTS
jgi:hypothetical protein